MSSEKLSVGPQAAARLMSRARQAVERAVRPTMPPDDLTLVGGPFEMVETRAGDLWMLSSDEVERPYLLEKRYWQHPTTTLVGSLLHERSKFLHVGAGVGYLALAAAGAAAGVTVTAVEPHPVLTRILRVNLWNNGVQADVHAVALGAAPRMIPIAWEDGDPSGYHFVEPGAAPRHDAVVAMTTADDLLAGNRFDVAVINARGWEQDVLVGMERIVQDSAGVVVVVDFWPTALRRRNLEPRGVLDRYRTMGFSLTVHDDWGLGNCAVEDVVAHCDSGGTTGRVRLVLRRGR